jgi:transcriptional regulator GlxA family with amidase domain
LGEAGLLDGRRANTHWLFTKQQRRYPKTLVEVDRI